MSWRIMILVVLCAVLSMGGTFTCKSSTRDRDDETKAQLQLP